MTKKICCIFSSQRQKLITDLQWILHFNLQLHFHRKYQNTKPWVFSYLHIIPVQQTSQNFLLLITGTYIKQLTNLPALFCVVATSNRSVEARPVLAYSIGGPNSVVTDIMSCWKVSGKGLERTSKFWCPPTAEFSTRSSRSLWKSNQITEAKLYTDPIPIMQLRGYKNWLLAKEWQSSW